MMRKAGNAYRAPVDRTLLKKQADALDFIAGVLQASTEYSIVGLGLDGTILLWNEGARRLYGYEPGEVLGRANAAILHVPEDVEKGRPQAIFDSALKHAKWEGALTCRSKTGEKVIAQTVVTPHRDVVGSVTGFLLMSRNLCEDPRLGQVFRAQLDDLVHAESVLREREERYRIVTETAADAMISIDDKGLIVFANAAVEKIFGYSAPELLGRELTVLMPERLHQSHWASFERYRATGEKTMSWDGVELPGLHKDGREVSLEVSFGEYRNGAKHLFTGVIRDITERKHAEERARYLAQHDPLTGLPNRALLWDRVTQAIAQARRNHEKLAVLFLDLDGFKHINDSLGHIVGDKLLRLVARRLKGCLREGDSIGRLGGDEFVVCLPVHQDDSDAMQVAGKLLEAVREPARVDESELQVNASIGIALYPGDGTDAESLMRAADAAMYHAKGRGRNNFQFYTERLNEAAQRRASIAQGLRLAVKCDGLLLEYQPQVDLRSDEIVGVEALVRWCHPDLGPLLPDEFIKVAEETGLMGPVGDWVLRQACRQLARWRASGHPDLRISINLSMEQLRRAQFSESVLGALQECGLPPVALDLEISESALMMQTPENNVALERLAGTGIQFAVDDFGTGYSSLAYLRRYPVDTIKIDRSFVDGVARDPDDAALVTAIIAMAENLDLHVVAEGVETAEQVAFLKRSGCRAAQGFFFHRPMPAEAFGTLLGQ
jgi:diguanylate cyclase (GGDEF)-like protein/PAS domain S-box-containing protein